MKSNRKPNKLWAEKISESFNRKMEKISNKHYTEIYSAESKGKSVVIEIFIRTLKNLIFKHPAAIHKKECSDKLDDIVPKYNVTIHSKGWNQTT